MPKTSGTPCVTKKVVPSLQNKKIQLDKLSKLLQQQLLSLSHAVYYTLLAVSISRTNFHYDQVL